VDQKTEKTISSLGTGFSCDPIMATQSGIPLPIHVTKVVPIFLFPYFFCISWPPTFENVSIGSCRREHVAAVIKIICCDGQKLANLGGIRYC